MIRANIRTPGAIAFFQTQRFYRTIAGIDDAEFRTHLHQGVIDSRNAFHRNVQFPAEFANIGHAQGQHRCARNIYSARLPERKGGVGNIITSEFLQHAPRIGAHQREHGIR